MKFYKLTIAIDEATEEVDFISEELYYSDTELDQMEEASEEVAKDVIHSEQFENWLKMMIRRKFPVVGYS